MGKSRREKSEEAQLLWAGVRLFHLQHGSAKEGRELGELAQMSAQKQEEQGPENKVCIKERKEKHFVGAGEMVQQRGICSLIEDLGLFPSTHVIPHSQP